MDRRYFIFLGLITLCWTCQEPELKVPMKIPDTKPSLFDVQTGLPLELKKEKVIFEKYRRTIRNTSEASRLYENGDFYETYQSSHENLEENCITWKKMGVFTPYYINQLQKISNTHVVHYLNNGPYEMINSAGSNSDWYFYFDEPKFVQSQGRMFQLPWNQQPKFARKIDAILERNRNYENLVK